MTRTEQFSGVNLRLFAQVSKKRIKRCKMLILRKKEGGFVDSSNVESVEDKNMVIVLGQSDHISLACNLETTTSGHLADK